MAPNLGISNSLIGIIFLFASLPHAPAHGNTTEFWTRLASDELENSLKVKNLDYPAKNVIFFIGDGMGPGTVTAARILRAGETSSLSWERFDHMGLLKTYTNDKQVPDSAATATAMFTGVKTNYRTTGVSPEVKFGDCEASLVGKNRLETIATWAQNKGLGTGFVTTMKVTHATPSALYAHSSVRHWECDTAVPKNAPCKDIGRQLVEDYPGKGFNVIMGGGRDNLVSHGGNTTSPFPWICYRGDGRNLIEEWLENKKKSNALAATVNSTGQLFALDYDKYDNLIGIFHDDHLPYDHKRDKGPGGQPSLEQMTIGALKILKKNEKGFLLMVEAGLIDSAHHWGEAGIALDETLRLNDAVNSTMAWLRQEKMLKDTLVIVTSDHSHTLTINGYPDRGNHILGIAEVSPIDNTPYATLSYGTVGPKNYKFSIQGNQVVREDPSKLSTTSFGYHPPGAILHRENLHGGVDVAIHATGPMAHLFRKTHEQNYVAHVIQYALRIGRYGHAESSPLVSAANPSLINVRMILIVVFFKCFMT